MTSLRDCTDRGAVPPPLSLRVSIAVCAHCGGPVATFASMCPRCGHRAGSGGTVVIGGVPVFGSRRKRLFSLVARRMVTMLLVSAAVAGVFLLSHVSRPQNTHQADDQEEQCRAIEEAGEEYVGELAECQSKLARLRLLEREHARAEAGRTSMDGSDAK